MDHPERLCGSNTQDSVGDFVVAMDEVRYRPEQQVETRKSWRMAPTKQSSVTINTAMHVRRTSQGQKFVSTESIISAKSSIECFFTLGFSVQRQI